MWDTFVGVFRGSLILVFVILFILFVLGEVLEF